MARFVTERARLIQSSIHVCKGGIMLKDLEKELKRWREKRATQKPPVGARPRDGALPTATDRRTVRVNGQEVVVVKKGRKAI
jgi:hypothetical protein